MSNPLLAPYPILSSNTISATTSNSPAQASGGFLGADGFLSKAGETLIDLAGLYGTFELEKKRIEVQEQASGKNPEIAGSRWQAGIPIFGDEDFKYRQFVQDNRVPIYIVGGIAVVGILAAITLAATRGK